MLPLARVVLQPLSALPGSAASDVFKHTWAYWHLVQQLQEGSWPFTRFIGAPTGGTLLDVMLVPALLLAPVTLTAGPVLAANLYLLLSLVAVGGAVYALARTLSGDTAGPLAAGLICQTTPFLLGHALMSGVHERLSVWIFPLILLCLLRLRGGGGWRWIALLWSGEAACILQCPTYGLFTAVLLLFCLPLVVGRARSRHQWRSTRRVLLALAGAAALLGGGFLFHSWFVNRPDFLAGIPHERVALSMGSAGGGRAEGRSVASPRMLLDPVTAREEQPMMEDDELYRTVYLGWIPLLALMGGLAMAARRRRWTAAAVVGLGLAFGVLALGASLDLLGLKLPNPLFHLVSYLVPCYGMMPTLWQQVGLLVSISSAGIALLVSEAPGGRPRAALAAALVLATLGERALTLPFNLVLPATPARVSSIYTAAVGEGGLVDIPRLFRSNYLSPGIIFLAQTVHGHPIPAAINIGVGTLDSYPPVREGRAEDWGQVIRCLRGRGFRWLVLHRSWYPDGASAATAAAGIQKAAGPPAATTAEEVLYDLNRAGPHRPGPSDHACPKG